MKKLAFIVLFTIVALTGCSDRPATQNTTEPTYIINDCTIAKDKFGRYTIVESIEHNGHILTTVRLYQGTNMTFTHDPSMCKFCIQNFNAERQIKK